MTTPNPAAVELGHWTRTCDGCGRAWGPTRCSNSKCASVQFTDRYHEPKPISTRIQEKLAPKPKAPRATASQTSALRALLDTVTHLLVDLNLLNEQLREAVRADVEELRPAQALTAEALSITGDASPARIAGVSLSLTALAAALSGAIKNLEDTPK